MPTSRRRDRAAMDAVLARTADLTGTTTGDSLAAVLDPALRRQRRAAAHQPAEPEGTGNFALDVETQLTALEQGIKDRKRAERDRFRQATDSEYWVALCFTSREEKNRFLARAGLAEHGDKYLDGRVVAAALDVDMNP